LAAVKAVNTEAYDSYLKGVFHWEKFTEEGMRKALDDFENAIQKQADYAPAYAGLANTYHELAFYIAPKEVMPKGKEAAMRALELDGADAEAHAALGWIKWHFDWDWRGAEQEYARALKLNPGSGMAMAHGQYALFLAAMGRFDEALREHELLEATDPLSLGSKTNLGDIFSLARRYDKAVQQYRYVLELDPNFAIAQLGLGMAYVQQGKLQDGIVNLRKASQLDTDPGYAGMLGYAYAVAGDKAQARRIIAQLVERSRKSYISPVGVALIYLGMGEESQSCEWLERGYQVRDSYLAYIKVDPVWDKLRPNACFQSLMQRMWVLH
jgi:adenylate cyclase